ncbi:OmpH family outer membrane protein [Rhodobacter capsulatus]|uniref:Periplasmic chaperone for outer membrane proteins Skp n=1 Tax=Rhodobacter capsulatus TaxID=1061 RepID=A0A1G7JFV9_RHOCA|nr:OmpH family outer membrane protein [Rhodobacter capsulatus]PZX27288.1 periplasmic chaperone for outer membrane proteins Skp [Rhodobacter capsulatus]QNR64375.1 OmpH family outer membrane protein [Rhodobacter capsulatus]WER07829.1 OmpH family outer membrane protein [Rhodobacter capsulatus]SDF23806.1 periplasmic chaperone for outer membrane proteins Skp [Rhodobacter capsulatus]
MRQRKALTGPGSLPGLLRLCLAAAVLALGLAAPVRAEPVAPAAVPVLTLDFERLFDDTLWGKAIAAEMTRESTALAAENTRIADDLIAEEKLLTERRAKLTPAAFRAEADAFDERATGIRAAQKAKAQALTQSFEAAQQAFFVASGPLIDEILTRRGAVMVLDRRAIIRGLEAADITEDLARLMDARLGAGPAAAPGQPGSGAGGGE